ncbi:MAG: hypothetical protein U0163_21630 [Gemmatimonadaceae bacterium]
MRRALATLVLGVAACTASRGNNGDSAAGAAEATPLPAAEDTAPPHVPAPTAAPTPSAPRDSAFGPMLQVDSAGTVRPLDSLKRKTRPPT